jgi:hypothetical protein
MAVANMMASKSSGFGHVRGTRPHRRSFPTYRISTYDGSDALGSFLQSIQVSRDSICGLSAVAAVCPRSGLPSTSSTRPYFLSPLKIVRVMRQNERSEDLKSVERSCSSLKS